jgi:hypothetical protein
MPPYSARELGLDRHLRLAPFEPPALRWGPRALSATLEAPAAVRGGACQGCL